MPPRALTLAWLALVGLTLISLGLGREFSHAGWLPLLVAGIIWLKGNLVACHFIESPQSHPLIAWLLRVFIAFGPLWLIVTAYWGAELAHLTRL